MHTSGHKFEVHYGVVSGNDDPEQRGRLKVQCGTLIPEDGELPEWVEPLFPFLSSSGNQESNGGWLFIPDVGVIVELRVMVGSHNDEMPGFSAIVAPNVRWQACSAARGSDTIAEVFKTNYPARRGVSTGRGHYLAFDDTRGSELLELYQEYNGGSNTVSMTPTGLLADVKAFTIANTPALATRVIIEGTGGTGGLQASIAAALTEITGLLSGLGMAAPTTTSTVIPALTSKAFSSTLTKSE